MRGKGFPEIVPVYDNEVGGVKRENGITNGLICMTCDIEEIR